LAGLFFGLSRDLSRLGGFLLPGFHEDSLRKSGRNIFLETILLDPMPQFTLESIQWTSGKNAQYFTIDLGAQPGFSTVGSMIRLFGCGSQGTSEHNESRPTSSRLGQRFLNVPIIIQLVMSIHILRHFRRYYHQSIRKDRV